MAGAGLGKRLAVVGIEIPLSACGLITLHQHIVSLTHGTVEKLHAQLFAASGVRGKVAGRSVEVPVFAHFQRHLMGSRHGFDQLQHPPVAGLDHDQLRGTQALQSALQFGSQTARVGRVVQVGVVHCEAGGTQVGRKVAHRGQKQGDARLGGPDMGGLFRHLGHPHRILRRVEPVERAGLRVELITQHQH